MIENHRKPTIFEEREPLNSGGGQEIWSGFPRHEKPCEPTWLQSSFKRTQERGWYP